MKPWKKLTLVLLVLSLLGLVAQGFASWHRAKLDREAEQLALVMNAAFAGHAANLLHLQAEGRTETMKNILTMLMTSHLEETDRLASQGARPSFPNPNIHYGLQRATDYVRAHDLGVELAQQSERAARAFEVPGDENSS